MPGPGDTPRDLRLGVIAGFGAALCTSLSAILVRLVEQADGRQILF